MKYIPKNRIRQNLKTSPNEFVYKLTKKPYNGDYFETYEGRFYTGKNPSNPPNIEIIKISSPDEPVYSDSNYQIASFSGPGFQILPNGDLYNEDLISYYSKLKKVDFTQPPIKNLPLPYYPNPTPEDYEVGEIDRFFCVKLNNSSIMEINKESYDKIYGQDPNWGWELYFVFILPWKISLLLNEEVISQNQSLVRLTAQRYSLPGLIEYMDNRFYI